ncbi:MAG TPA: UDP-N-acetylmuramoyl-L-alanyl-D-glutamate--2,6-diaminopimelate ligase [Gammaproteobacteria bacterium]|nr:UDP-N-acetylmuramoyl-L-alanyl-D-glutamate--2,6-diaminopimelate ligase [Gammaproteobacteria bacterium]
MSSEQANHTLSSLLAGMADVAAQNDRMIAGLALDSRKLQSGEVFVALAGTHEHGLKYGDAAVAQGAIAVIYEPVADIEAPSLNVPVIAVERLSEKLGSIASRYYAEPSRHLLVVGVTGTNGKTTCTTLLTQAMASLGKRTAMIGTTGSGEWGQVTASTHTTPDAIELQRQLADFQASGVQAIAMEVSSHALEQGRTNGTEFNVAVFTNLSHEHLDYHGSMQAYAAAKARLFQSQPLQLAVINTDDPTGMEMLESGVNAAQVLSYGLTAGDVRTLDLQLHSKGLRMQIQSPWGELQINSALLGRFNASNLLACAAVLLGCGWQPAQVGEVLSSAQSAPGRMECFRNDDYTVVVDFAHTPDALLQALTALREHLSGQKLWCVFGCGGERDAAKRPLMGQIAEQLADSVIVTDDNPRNEDARAIRTQILAGMSGTAQEIGDRRQAIEKACDEAGKGDIILLAGKGHETTQQIGDLKLPFNDRDLAAQLTGRS